MYDDWQIQLSWKNQVYARYELWTSIYSLWQNIQTGSWEVQTQILSRLYKLMC